MENMPIVHSDDCVVIQVDAEEFMDLPDWALWSYWVCERVAAESVPAANPDGTAPASPGPCPLDTGAYLLVPAAEIPPDEAREATACDDDAKRVALSNLDRLRSMGLDTQRYRVVGVRKRQACDPWLASCAGMAVGVVFPSHLRAADDLLLWSMSVLELMPGCGAQGKTVAGLLGPDRFHKHCGLILMVSADKRQAAMDAVDKMRHRGLCVRVSRPDAPPPENNVQALRRWLLGAADGN